jgi:hypothetical protein
MERLLLIGADEVTHAGHTIQNAADSMARSASACDSIAEIFSRDVDRFCGAADNLCASIDRLCNALTRKDDNQ